MKERQRSAGGDDETESRANIIHNLDGMYYNRQKLSEEHSARSVYFFLAPAFSAAVKGKYLVRKLARSSEVPSAYPW